MRGVPAGQDRRWTNETIERDIRAIAGPLGYLPSAQEMRSVGRNDLACIITKTGGFIAWADRLGLLRRESDSDKGWRGEVAFAELARRRFIEAERMDGVKAPFDILINSALKVDVKSANYAEYGVCRGWFYRIAKIPQADLIVLYQLDTGDFYGLPWFICPSSNATISRDGGKYAAYRNNWHLIRSMLGWRMAERAHCGGAIADVA